jgi:hypothetical protein
METGSGVTLMAAPLQCNRPNRKAAIGCSPSLTIFTAGAAAVWPIASFITVPSVVGTWSSPVCTRCAGAAKRPGLNGTLKFAGDKRGALTLLSAAVSHCLGLLVGSLLLANSRYAESSEASNSSVVLLQFHSEFGERDISSQRFGALTLRRAASTPKVDPTRDCKPAQRSRLFADEWQPTGHR